MLSVWDEQVPHLHMWRDDSSSWEDKLRFWLDGQIGCLRAKELIDGFLSMHRVRPDNDESLEDNSDGLLSDEELDVGLA